MTRTEIEAALDTGELWAAMVSRFKPTRYWRVRRNGKTQTWKTRPSEFSIPVKAGLREHARITETSYVATVGDTDWQNANFVNGAKQDPNEARRALTNA
jgi:hypothetical protein